MHPDVPWLRAASALSLIAALTACGGGGDPVTASPLAIDPHKASAQSADNKTTTEQADVHYAP
jgi:hypothetical protein